MFLKFLEYRKKYMNAKIAKKTIVVKDEFVFITIIFRLAKYIFHSFIPLLFKCFLIATNNTNMAIANQFWVLAVFYLSYFLLEFIIELLAFRKIKFVENIGDVNTPDTSVCSK